MTTSRRRFALGLALALALPLAAGTSARPAAADTTETVVLAGGCFWGMEAVFGALRGVTQAMPGYTGGTAATAHYDMVSTGMTGHAESVRVTYDPARISFEQLLGVYFTVAHDPTELNRQGPDDGTQYRSAIFVASADQRRRAEAVIARLTAEHRFSAPIVTKLETTRASTRPSLPPQFRRAASGLSVRGHQRSAQARRAAGKIIPDSSRKNSRRRDAGRPRPPRRSATPWRSRPACCSTAVLRRARASRRSRCDIRASFTAR